MGWEGAFRTSNHEPIHHAANPAHHHSLTHHLCSSSTTPATDHPATQHTHTHTHTHTLQFDTAKPYPLPPTDSLRATIYANASEDFTPPLLLSVPWVATGALDWMPGTKQDYSSTNFVLLGLILAYHSGADSWDQYDQRAFLPPAVAKELPSVKYVRHGAPKDVTRLHGYDSPSVYIYLTIPILHSQTPVQGRHAPPRVRFLL
jgi:hypothetical protein